MHVFSKNVFQNPLLIQHVRCARSALSFDPHSSHNTSRVCPQAFSECMTTTGAWGVVNPPESTPNIFADPRFGSVDSQIWWNVRLSGRYIYSSPTTVVIIHSRKCLRTISKVVVGAMLAKRERRMSAQIMLYQKWILEYVFCQKHAFFGHEFFFEGRFGGVRGVG